MNPQDPQGDKIESLLKQYKKEQRAFENHWLWAELKTTPQRFFESVNQRIRESGIDQGLWQQRLTEARGVIGTRLKEKAGDYRVTDFKNMKGIKI